MLPVDIQKFALQLIDSRTTSRVEIQHRIIHLKVRAAIRITIPVAHCLDLDDVAHIDDSSPDGAQRQFEFLCRTLGPIGEGGMPIETDLVRRSLTATGAN